MDGVSPALLRESAHRNIWAGMIGAFMGGNCTFLMLFQAFAEQWAMAILLAIPASIFWRRAIRRIRRANAILVHLESTSAPI